jgi:hypothetical protein
MKKNKVAARVAKEAVARRDAAFLSGVIATRAATTQPPPKIPTYNFRGKDTKLPSKPDTVGGGSKKSAVPYTGTAMVGIATMHKSNAVPVFSEQSAKDISKMRRG